MLKTLAVLLVAAMPVFSQTDSASDAGASGAPSIQVPAGQTQLGGNILNPGLDMNGQNLTNPLGQHGGLVPQIPSAVKPAPAQVEPQVAPASQAVSPAAPSVAPAQTVQSQGALAAPAVEPSAAPPESAAQTKTPAASQAQSMPRASQSARAPLGQAAPPVQAEEGLSRAATEISGAQASGAGPGAVLGVLNRVFEAERNRRSGIGGAGSAQVAGREADAKERIAYLVSQAASVAPEQAPALYQAAVDKTRESASTQEKLLRPAAGRALVSAILKSAVNRAKTALPQLADEAYKAAADSSSAGKKTLEGILGVGKNGESDWAQAPQPGALDEWQALLKEAGRPIENLAELKSDIERVQDEASAAPSGSRLASPRAAFALGHRGFAARIALSAVPKNVFASFAARPSLLAALPSLPEPIQAEQGKGYSSPSQAAAYLRRHGAGPLEVARFWVGYFTVWLRYEIFRIMSFFVGPGIPAQASAAQVPQIFSRLDARYRKAMASLPPPGAPMNVAEARAFLAESQNIAGDYVRVSGDASAEFIVRGFARQIDEQSQGLSPMSPAPDFVRQLIEPAGKDTLSHWMTRFHAAAAGMAK
ncbi:MAG TPA: hypothetical protein VNK24_11270 [Elusimicrobiota bacterium]|nr:hypothetical protein [Elusimicrobiota bacterium]